MVDDPHRLLIAREAAEQIGITTAGLTRMAERGALFPAAYILTGARLFDPAEVERIRKARAVLKMADRRRRSPQTQ